MTDQVIEYGIEWLEPEECAGSVTILGTGMFNKDKAFLYLEMSARLPGEMAGRVVQRTITWSPWKGAEDDGTASHLPRVTGFREVDPG